MYSCRHRSGDTFGSAGRMVAMVAGILKDLASLRAELASLFWRGRTSNLKMLYNEVAGAREFCTSGLVVSDKKVSVISVQHAQAHT